MDGFYTLALLCTVIGMGRGRFYAVVHGWFLHTGTFMYRHKKGWFYAVVSLCASLNELEITGFRQQLLWPAGREMSPQVLMLGMLNICYWNLTPPFGCCLELSTVAQ